MEAGAGMILRSQCYCQMNAGSSGVGAIRSEGAYHPSLLRRGESLSFFQPEPSCPLRERIKSLLLGSPVSRTLGWAEEHEKGKPLGDVVERMMYPSRDEDDCAGTDIEALGVSVRVDHHFRPSAGNVVNLVLGVRFLRVGRSAIQHINPDAK